MVHDHLRRSGALQVAATSRRDGAQLFFDVEGATQSLDSVVEQPATRKSVTLATIEVGVMSLSERRTPSAGAYAMRETADYRRPR